jgi:predicted transcriptional regulator of viral defense system
VVDATMTPKQFFAHHPVFTTGEFAAVLNYRAPSSHDSLLAYHHRLGHLLRIRRGLYATVPPGTELHQLAVDPYILAAKLAPDSILAHRSALSFHGAAHSTDHFPYLTDTAPRDFRFRGQVFQPVQFPKSLRDAGQTLWGVTGAQRDGTHLRVTSVERTLVDVLDRLDLWGNPVELWRSLESLKLLDLPCVVEYALCLGSATTAARVGFFLSQHREQFMVPESHLATLRAHRPRAPHYLEPRQRTGSTATKFLSDWNLIVPTTLLD